MNNEENVLVCGKCFLEARPDARMCPDCGASLLSYSKTINKSSAIELRKKYTSKNGLNTKLITTPYDPPITDQSYSSPTTQEAVAITTLGLAMRLVIYLFGWIFFFFLASLLLQMAVRPFFGLISLGKIEGILFTVVRFSPIAIISFRAYSWVKARKITLPSSFNGWRYGLCFFGFWFSFVVFAGTVALGFMAPVGGMSGVPLGLALMFSGLLCAPAILATELIDWRNRASASP